MKLKKLLDKHKDNLWDGGYNQLVIDNGAWENYKGIIICKFRNRGTNAKA